jgi:hypothetical protein
VPDWIDNYVETSALVPSPEIYRLWSAITAVSGVMERKVWTNGGAGPIYPNLFTLLVGPPASGKTNAIRPIRDLWTKVNGLNISPDNVTKAALIDSLSRSVRTVINGAASAHIFCSMVVPCSELGIFISHHDLEFLSVLTHIYDNPSDYIEERRSVGKIEINKPHLVVLAGTQPDFMNSLLPEEAWGQGFTSRLIMVYAGAAPPIDLFSFSTVKSTTLVEGLRKIFEYKGEFVWSRNAIDEINAWNKHNCPPTPTHNKLLNYNGRRAVHTIKLAMISCASRGADLHVTVEDFERAKDWLLAVEVTMPDIFRAMGQKSDLQIIADMHFFLYRKWSSVAVDKRRPLLEKDLYEFLHSRVPSERIPRLIEVAAKSGYITSRFPGEWVPNLMTGFGTV